jgi:hypothetical protein
MARLFVRQDKDGDQHELERNPDGGDFGVRQA